MNALKEVVEKNLAAGYILPCAAELTILQAEASKPGRWENQGVGKSTAF